MAGAGVEFTRGMAPADAKKVFADIQNRIPHASAFWRAVAFASHRDVMEHFANESGPKTHWAPWSPGYAASKAGGIAKAEARRNAAVRALAEAKGAVGGKILAGAGILRGSIIWEGNDGYARLFSNLPYAAIHQYGMLKGYSSKRPNMSMPQREYLWISDSLQAHITDAFGPWLISGMVTV